MSPRTPLMKHVVLSPRSAAPWFLSSARALASWSWLVAMTPSGCVAATPTLQATRLNARGASLLSRGELDAAEASLQLALEYDTRDPEAHNNLGLVALARGRVAQARRSFRAALARNEDFAEAWSNLGLALLRSAEPEAPADPLAAIEALREALSIDPGIVAPRINLARALLAFGRRREALDQARRVCVLAPREAAVHALRAEAALSLALPEEADEASSRSVALAPFAPDALLTRARVLAAAGRCDESLRVLERILNDPGRGDRARALRAVIERAHCAR
jgi:tetratricopeptide (TPR) repeat protein